MKTSVRIILAVFCSSAPGLAGDFTLHINARPELWFTGRLGNSYQFESSTNLLDWTTYGTFFSVVSVPHTQPVSDASNSQSFFRVRALVSATNNSVPTLCSEEDNINIPLRGDVRRFTITATHPGYVVTNCDCPTNFANCTNSDPGYNFTYLSTNLFDDHTNVIRLRRETNYWRPYGMEVSVNGTNQFDDIHYLALHQKLPDEESWPEFCVLYADGNMRLIPQPPFIGVSNVCYGSSVIVGPAADASRPLAEIASADYRSSAKELFVMYRDGGSAVLDVGLVGRTNSVVKVTVNYPTDRPFCTFRSMFVTEGNSDAALVEWNDLSEVTHKDPITSFSGTVGTGWFFKREIPSMHNLSAPDIRIVPY